MSILFHTKGWLTLYQLARAWAAEFPGAERDPKVSEQNLAQLLLEDVVNGRLDDAGPPAEGQRLGLRIVTPDLRAGFVEGRQILDILRSGGDAEFLAHRIVVMKEAALAFAQRHNLPLPSFSQNGAVDLPITAAEGINETAALKSGTPIENSANLSLPRSRGRKPKKLNGTEEAMREDIRQNRLTASQLDKMTEVKLAEKYGVSRDTARKARNAVQGVDRHKNKNDN
jgi:Bacterial regulatory proteins, gntR family